MKLSKNTVEEYKQYTKKSEVIKEIIEDRITKIIKFIVEDAGYVLDTWYFSDADEGQMGTLHIYDDYISNIEIHLASKSSILKNDFIYIIDGYEWSFMDGKIPTKWLFDDFEEEIKNGRKLYLKEFERKKELRAKRYAANKIKKEKIQKSIRSKLTKEELKLVKLL